MENKKVGWLILGIATFVAMVVYIFHYSLNEIVTASCSHGDSCSMYDTMTSQLWLSFAIVGIIVGIGLYIMFTKPEEKIVIQKVKEKAKVKKLDLEGLDKIEVKAIGIIQEEGTAMFQKDLMEKLEVGKVKMTRLLDKLEAKQLIIRKRRGMNNIVVLRN